MKKSIVLAALIATTQASAFWGWNESYNDGYGNAANNGYFDGVGAGYAEADFTLDFKMSARMRGEGRGYGYGNGNVYGDGDGYGYNAHVPYYGAPYGYGPMVPVAPMAPPAE